jgi:heme/copper-type cytochrome/quinol oxidase subunit 2
MAQRTYDPRTYDPRFDHRPTLLIWALATAVCVIVLAVATFVSVQSAAPPGTTNGNPGAAAANHLPHRPNMAAGGESYGWSNKTRGGSYRWNIRSQDQRPGVHDQAGGRHAKPVSD